MAFQCKCLMKAFVALLCCAPIVPAADGDAYTAEERSHWSLQTRSQPLPPTITAPDEAARLSSPIDAFVLSKLRGAGLNFSPPAERRTLARRLHFNLLGLPPTPDAIEAFVADRSPDAYERLVDRLLAN